jgi:hypothetical protein
VLLFVISHLPVHENDAKECKKDIPNKENAEVTVESFP